MDIILELLHAPLWGFIQHQDSLGSHVRAVEGLIKIIHSNKNYLHSHLPQNIPKLKINIYIWYFYYCIKNNLYVLVAR